MKGVNILMEELKRKSWFYTLQRSRVEIILAFFIGILTFFIPPSARQGLLGLLITKPLFVSLGVLYAHISRQFLFPYIDISKEIENHHWGSFGFMTVWYGVIIYAFAMGG